MVTLLITSAIIISLLGIAVYFWQKSDISRQPSSLPVPQGARGLFTDEAASQEQASEQNEEREKLRRTLLDRAASGDKTALQDAHSIKDSELYNRVLHDLTMTASNDAQLLSLISHLTRSELPVSSHLAARMLETWKKSPDRSGTAKTLHIIALSDDASLYNSAIEDALQFWREGRLADVSPLELSALFDGEFWLLSPQVRGSGAGFLLKRTLANARRELKAQARVNQ